MYLGDARKSVLLKSAKASTKEGTDESHRIRNDVDAYQVTGPLGSKDPTLPLDLKDLEAKLLGQDDKLRQLWLKRNIYDWSHKQGNETKPSKPSKRDAGAMSRVRLPGERCQSCLAVRTYTFARLKRLRIELRAHFDILTYVLQVSFPSIFQFRQNL